MIKSSRGTYDRLASAVVWKIGKFPARVDHSIGKQSTRQDMAYHSDLYLDGERQTCERIAVAPRTWMSLSGSVVRVSEFTLAGERTWFPDIGTRLSKLPRSTAQCDPSLPVEPA